MARAAAKFFGEQDTTRHGGPLHWTSYGNGIPFRANGPGIPMMAPGEFDELPVVRDFNQRTFDLSNPTDAQEYSWVMDRIGNGLFQERYTDRWREEGKMFVYVEWFQLYRIVPKGHRESQNVRSSSSGSATVGF